MTRNRESLINKLFILISFLSLYLIKVIESFAWSGAYILLFVLCLLASLDVWYKVKQTIFSWLSFISFSMCVFYIISGDASGDGILYYSLKFLRPFLFYYSIIILLSFSNSDNILSDIEMIINIYIVYLIIEAVSRYLYVYYNMYAGGNILTSFYYFKHGIISSGDTNFLGLDILYVLCLLLFLYKFTSNKIWMRKTFIFMVFIILTFSRSAIMTGFFILILKHILFLLRKKQYIVLHIEVGLSLLLAIIVFNYIQNDGSFNTKLDALDGLNKIHDYKPNNILFGFGFAKGIFAYSYREGAYGHLHIALLLGQYGIFGIIIFIAFFMQIYIITRGCVFFLILAFLISGFSLMHFSPAFFWVLGVLTVLSKKKILLFHNSRNIKT